MARFRIRPEHHPYAFVEWCIYSPEGQYLCKEATLAATLERVRTAIRLQRG